jgi:hypothetical protein
VSVSISFGEAFTIVATATLAGFAVYSGMTGNSFEAAVFTAASILTLFLASMLAASSLLNDHREAAARVHGTD